MKKLTFWQETVIGPDKDEVKWHCSDGVSTYFGDTKAEAAAHFGVPVGFDDVKNAAAALGRVKSDRK